jgi:hemolysin activation/secretion protein
MNYNQMRRILLAVSISAACISAANAQRLPGPADVGRIIPAEPLTETDHSHDGQVVIPQMQQSEGAPEAAKGIHFVLKGVTIEGVTAFKPEQVTDIYTAYIGKEVTLDVAWMIAGSLTERYRNAGYFLSRAYVPQQRIAGGQITIKVVEGYIGKVDMGGSMPERYIINKAIASLLEKKPVTAAEVESFLLRLNDLPGLSFRSVLSPISDAGEGAVRLTLIPAKKENKGMISFDNASSRFLGPNEVFASYSANLLPLQQTTLSGLTSLPFDKLRYGTLNHRVVIAPDLSIDLTGGVTKAYPGYTLERFDINSHAYNLGALVTYQWIRQREENLAFTGGIDGRNVTSEILHTPLTRDHIRTVRAGANYEKLDDWKGDNTANFTLSQGINGLGASHEDDLNLSRAGAKPDFTKATLSLSRLQDITDNWSLLAAADGQLASGTLYSSEQFGYGGQAFGRAFDASEFTGDQGISGSLEMRYGGWSDWQPVSLQPYAFYDIGTVWNDADSQPKRKSASSAGFGMRFATSLHQSGNIGLAFPLLRDIGTPIYGGTSHSPRILLQFSQGF